MRKATLRLVMLLALSGFLGSQAQAQTLTILYSFAGGVDGAYPMADLVMDKRGNLYGTTAYGGSFGHGTVFKLDRCGNETVLHSFANTPDGAVPFAGLILGKRGDLYGTTLFGGSSVYGTVFKLEPFGSEIVLHSFTNSDGANPLGDLIIDESGSLYGTAANLASNDYGLVFKLDASGNETVLHTFTGAPDGAHPVAGLVMDKAGNLYGTTNLGGAFGIPGTPFGPGAVFKVDTSGNETVLHSFPNVGSDGAYPQAALVMDKAGNLYGTTGVGGSGGDGVVFKLDTAGKETVLHSFIYSDGANPLARLIMDRGGNLYGTTAIGGSSIGGSSVYGTVFKLDKDGNEIVLHSFANTPDGATPLAGLIIGKRGNLYGTTEYGGAYGYGTVFDLRLLDACTSPCPTTESLRCQAIESAIRP